MLQRIKKKLDKAKKSATRLQEMYDDNGKQIVAALEKQGELQKRGTELRARRQALAVIKKTIAEKINPAPPAIIV